MDRQRRRDHSGEHSTAKMMLIALTVVTSLATTNAFVPEFSEVSFELYHRVNKNALVRAQFINPDTNVIFQRSNEQELREITLYPKYQGSSDELSEGKPFIYENFHTIRLIEEEDESCEVIYFKLVVTLKSYDLQKVYFVLQFGFGPRTHIRLIIPVFEIPGKVASLSEEEVLDWFSTEEVGLIDPVETAKLLKIAGPQPIEFDFSWLSKLVQYGIYKKGLVGRNKVQTCVTRPIIFRKEIISELVQLVNPGNDTGTDSGIGTSTGTDSGIGTSAGTSSGTGTSNNDDPQ